VQDHETEEENPFGSHLFFADLPTLEDDGACTEESGLKTRHRCLIYTKI